jgi:hypothetical protein
VAVVDHQEVETDEDWAVEADHQRQEDTQRMGVEEDADVVVAAVVGDVAAVVGNAAVVGDHGAVVVEDLGAVVGLVHKKEAVGHLRLEAAVHESHLVVAADLLHPERAVEALSYVAVEVHPVPSVEVHHRLPEEVE